MLEEIDNTTRVLHSEPSVLSSASKMFEYLVCCRSAEHAHAPGLRRCVLVSTGITVLCGLTSIVAGVATLDGDGREAYVLSTLAIGLGFLLVLVSLSAAVGAGGCGVGVRMSHASADLMRVATWSMCFLIVAEIALWIWLEGSASFVLDEAARRLATALCTCVLVFEGLACASFLCYQPYAALQVSTAS